MSLTSNAFEGRMAWMKAPIVFGKFLLLERISVGGMAEIFIAQLAGLGGIGRVLALKRILPTVAENEELVSMFVEEARLGVQMNHPNIVPAYELGQHGRSLYIALEYVRGQNLGAVLKRCQAKRLALPMEHAVFIATKICRGLEYAHSHRDPAGKLLNLVHQDISPQNVLLSYDGEIKVIDFGIAAANRRGKNEAAAAKGKVNYMSPEQANGLLVDRRSDLFSVGVLLYEMLTGRRPFSAAQDAANGVDVPPPGNLNPAIPPVLDAVVIKALAANPNRRPQTASELIADLASVLPSLESVNAAERLAKFLQEIFASEVVAENIRMQKLETLSSSARLVAPAAKSVPGSAEAFSPMAQPASQEATSIVGWSAEDLGPSTATTAREVPISIGDTVLSPTRVTASSAERTRLEPLSRASATPVMPAPMDPEPVRPLPRRLLRAAEGPAGPKLPSTEHRYVLGTALGVMAAVLAVSASLARLGPAKLDAAQADRLFLESRPAGDEMGRLETAGTEKTAVSAPEHRIDHPVVVQNSVAPRAAIEVSSESPVAYRSKRMRGGASPRNTAPSAVRGSARASGKLACRTFAAGAELWIDGKYSGRSTPISLSNPIELPVGSHRLLFKMPDGSKQSTEQIVQIRHNEITKLVSVPLE